ncbi:hypothetical protein P3580_23710, partial [Vibrio parahaemolyticus]|nr:hypothetical protein [Vibrio parahaemolyticus]
VQKSNESKDMEIWREGWQVEPKTKNHHKPSKGKVLDSGKSRNLDESTPVIHCGGSTCCAFEVPPASGPLPEMLARMNTEKSNGTGLLAR